MAQPAERRMTLEEFLEWDDGTDARFELVGGRVMAMAPPRVAHARIVGNVIGAVRPRLLAPCAVLGEASVVPQGRRDTWYQVDVVVTCKDDPAGAQYVSEPALLVEVLSPSTTSHDREAKLPDYRAIASVREILLISSRRKSVELWRREGDHWRVEDLIGDATVPLAVLASPLTFADIYEGVAFEEGFGS